MDKETVLSLYGNYGIPKGEPVEYAEKYMLYADSRMITTRNLDPDCALDYKDYLKTGRHKD